MLSRTKFLFIAGCLVGLGTAMYVLVTPFDSVLRNICGAFGAGEDSCPPPTLQDVSYGTHPRNLLDLWQAEATEPTPVVVFIHPGAFLHGDKAAAHRFESHRIEQCLKNGVSFVSINYRLRTMATLDEILRDCGRAIQHLRARAEEWNLDTTRIAAYGNSAGGGASLWLAVHDDLADPESSDPVLQQSTRLCAAGHLRAQATYDCEQWAEIVGIDPDWATEWDMRDDLPLYGVASRSEVRSPRAQRIRARVDMLAYLDASDPPLYIHNELPDSPPTNCDEVIHHPRHAFHLAERCRAAGIPIHLVTAEDSSSTRFDVVDFFLDRFQTSEGNSPHQDGD